MNRETCLVVRETVLGPNIRLPPSSHLYVTKYVPVGLRPLSPDETKARHTARALKIPTWRAIQIAAPQMAALIDGPCWLVPVPASNCNLVANLQLARAIAGILPEARVKCAVGRVRPIGTSHTRRVQGLPRWRIEAHGIIRTVAPIPLVPVFFVDNVITTGTTIAACRRALGWGTGLVYADASKPCAAREILSK